MIRMKSFIALAIVIFPLLCQADADTTSLYKRFNNKAAGRAEQLEVLTKLTELHKFTPDSMFKYANLGIKLAVRLHQDGPLANFYHLLAVAKLNKSDFHGALIEINKAIAINQKLRDFRGMGRTIKIRAIIHYYQSDYEQAIKDFSGAIDNFARSGYRIDLPTCYIFMAEVSRKNDDEELGLSYDKKAYQTSLELDASVPKNDPARDIVDLNYIQSLGNLADYYGIKGDRKTELKYLNIALARSNKKQYYPTYLIYLANAAECEFKMGRKARGLMMAEQARKLAKENGEQRAEANALVKLMMMAGSIKEMLAFYHQGLDIAKSIENDQLIGNFYITKSDMLEQFGDYKNALAAHQLYIRTNDSVQKQNRKDRISKMETAFRLKENAYKLSISEQKNLQKDARIKRFIIAFASLGVLTGVFILLSYWIWKLNVRVRSQNKTLNSLNEFKDSMLQVIGHDVSGMLSAMGSIIHLLHYKQPPGEQQDEDLATLSILKQQAFELLDSLLIWGESDKNASYSVRSFSVRNALANDLQTIANMARFYHVDIEVNIDELMVDFHEQHFKFIVRNLALNSLKYAKQGYPVTLNIHREGEVISVMTTNRADEDNISRLKLVFSKLGDTKIERVGGAALALRLSLSLAEKNNAVVDFSERDGWVSLQMLLPVKKS